MYHIVDFVTNEDYLKEMLDFDPEQFFKIMTKLFIVMNFKFNVTVGLSPHFDVQSQRLEKKLKLLD